MTIKEKVLKKMEGKYMHHVPVVRTIDLTLAEVGKVIDKISRGSVFGKNVLGTKELKKELGV